MFIVNIHFHYCFADATDSTQVARALHQFHRDKIRSLLRSNDKLKKENIMLKKMQKENLRVKMIKELRCQLREEVGYKL
jgi:hypothetical protein